VAVIACKNCGTKVNSEAMACPACGADPRSGEGGSPSSTSSSGAYRAIGLPGGRSAIFAATS
jgi:uncharacterized membrane protein YvbJ